MALLDLQDTVTCQHIAAGAGHWRLGHVLRNFVLAQAFMLFQFAAFALLQHNSKLQKDFGFVAVQPALVQFILFGYLLSPLDGESQASFILRLERQPVMCGRAPRHPYLPFLIAK